MTYQKGKVFERRLCDHLDEIGGFTARRTQQYKGTGDSADVEALELDRCHIECKADQSVRPGRKEFDQAWAKCCEEAKEGAKVPVLFYKQTRRPWVLVIGLSGYPVLVTDEDAQAHFLRKLQGANDAGLILRE